MERNKIFINRQFNCSASSLFNWLVNPALIAQWFGPKHFDVGVVKADLKIGSRYSIELIKPNGQHFFIEGKYLSIHKPDEISFSFHYKNLPSSPPDSIVKIIIKNISEKNSHLYLTQEFVTVPSDMINRTASWEYMLFRLSSKIPQN